MSVLYQRKFGQSSDMGFKPFKQRPFSSLSEKPKRQHDYFDTEAHDLKMQSKTFGEMTVHFRKQGQGPALLLIHGLMTSSYSWRYLLAPLSNHFTLYMPDLPGAGRSTKVRSVSYEPKNLARWVLEFQEAVAIKGCPIIGNSLGGYLAMHLALMSPKAMSRLINIHSPAFATFKMRALHLVLRPRFVKKLLLRLVSKAPKRWAHKNVHYYDESIKSLEEAKEYGRPLEDPEGAACFVDYLYDTLAPRSFKHLIYVLSQAKQMGVDFPVPLLLIYARTDPMVPPQTGEKLYRLIPSAKLLWLDKSSHFAHVDSTEALVEPILDFLGAQPNEKKS
jgi:pimeloyl-ACP methyl ester carboxylesterase